jgi:hypothetical protein
MSHRTTTQPTHRNTPLGEDMRETATRRTQAVRRAQRVIVAAGAAGALAVAGFVGLASLRATTFASDDDGPTGQPNDRLGSGRVAPNGVPAGRRTGDDEESRSRRSRTTLPALPPPAPAPAPTSGNGQQHAVTSGS